MDLVLCGQMTQLPLNEREQAMKEHLTRESVRTSTRRPTRRQLRNGSLWLLTLAYWQMVGTPLAHFALLTMPHHNRSILVAIGNAHSWWDAFSSGWMLVGSELLGIFVTGLSALGVIFLITLATGTGDAVRRSLLREPPMDD